MKIFSTFTVLLTLFLGGCHNHISPGPLAAPAVFSVPQSNVKVHWDRQEFLYTDAPLDYNISPDGTLVPPLTRYDIDNQPLVPARFETYVIGLTASPDHRTLYYSDGNDLLNHISRYYVGLHGGLVLKQTFTGGDHACYLSSMAFIGRQQFLYVMYNQYHASRIILNHCVLVAYKIGLGGRVEKLPASPITAATYTTAAIVANPGMTVAYPITATTHFLYVARPQDRYIDIYGIRPSGTLSDRPVISFALGYKPGQATFQLNSKTLYVTDLDHERLVEYQIGPDGMPLPVPKTVPGTDAALDRQGRFLYAVAPGGHSLLCYHILDDGSLHLQGSTATHAFCFVPCVDATGRFVYALGHEATQENNHVISQFRIMSDGTLSPLQPEYVPAESATVLVTAQ